MKLSIKLYDRLGERGKLIYNSFMSEKEILQGREVILEFHPIGAYVKVSAMDVASVTEVSIQGPASAPEHLLKQNALKRLEYVLRKQGLL